MQNRRACRAYAGMKPMMELQPNLMPHILIALSSRYARRFTFVRTSASALGICGLIRRLIFLVLPLRLGRPSRSVAGTVSK